jgi:heme A synthase
MNRLEKLTLYSLILLLIWGNMVSGLGAGLACPDWPLCFGQFFPQINFPIFMEHGHRVMGLVVSIFFFLLARRRFKTYLGKHKLIPIIAALLLSVQIILGGLVVIYELETNLTTFHFGNAIVIFLFIYTMCKYEDSKSLSKVFFFSANSGKYLFFLLLIYFQLVMGAYVRHSNAGLACPDFPTCLGYWIPPYLSDTVLYHLTHRMTGYLIFIVTLFFLLFNYTKKNTNQLKRFKKLFVLVIFQIAIGVYVVISKLAFSMTAIHLFVALLILMIALDAIFDENMSTNK